MTSIEFLDVNRQFLDVNFDKNNLTQFFLSKSTKSKKKFTSCKQQLTELKINMRGGGRVLTDKRENNIPHLKIPWEMAFTTPHILKKHFIIFETNMQTYL